VNLGTLVLAVDGPNQPNEGYENVVRIVRSKPAPVPTWDLVALGEVLLGLGKLEEALDVYIEATKRESCPEITM